MLDVGTYWGDPWCLCGDWNVVRFSNVRTGEQLVSTVMQNFNKIINDFGLIDILPIGSSYTWSRNESISRIDRFLVDNDWEDHFVRLEQQILVRPFSDHWPLSLTSEGEGWGEITFRFQEIWFEDPHILNLMKNWWESASFHGNPGFVMAKKLQFLKGKLKEWNKNVFGNFNRKIEENLVQIQRLDAEQRLIGLMDTLRSSILQAKCEFHKLSKLKDIYWRQQARVEWFMQNERNTKFFHKRASSRQRSNSSSQLNVNGSLTSDKEIIKSTIVEYYSELFRETATSRPQLDGLNFPSINAFQAAALEGPCDEEEVRRAIHALGGDRSQVQMASLLWFLVDAGIS